MSVLNLERVWLDDNTCYRKWPIEGPKDAVNAPLVEDEKYPILPGEFLNAKTKPETEDYDKLDILIQKDNNNRFYTCIPVPDALIGYIKGKYSSKQKSIEQDTNSSINIPSKKDYHKNLHRAQMTDVQQGTTNITVTGDTKRSVYEAYHRIKDAESTGRSWQEFTHFISFPINSQDIQESFIEFQKTILSERKARGVSESIFSNEMKLHLTLCMLTLLNKHDIERVTETLKKSQEFISGIIRDKPLTVIVKGVEYMNDDPSEVEVLYGKVEEPNSDNRLQIIADYLAKSFMDTGLSPKPTIPVKLHVTLMKSEIKDHQRLNFDARPILKKYENYVFGSMKIEGVHISIRYTKGADGYYKATYVLKL